MTHERPKDARTASDAPRHVVESFTAATLTAFAELARTHLVPGEPYFTRIDSSDELVIAQITLRRAMPGQLLAVFPRKVLEVLVSRYMPAGLPMTTEILEDAAGEFANVIAGQSKTMLLGTLYHFALSTPKIGLQANDLRDEREFLVLPFEFDAGAFAVYVALPPCEEQALDRVS